MTAELEALEPALTRDEARDLVDGIVTSMGSVLERVQRAYSGRAWVALGYASWSELCAAEFGRLRLPREERADLVRQLTAAGMSGRAAAAALGVDERTARRDMAPASAALAAEETVPPPTVPPSTPPAPDVDVPTPPRPEIDDLHALAGRMEEIAARGPDPRLPCGCDPSAPGLIVTRDLDPTGERCPQHDPAARQAAQQQEQEQRREDEALAALGGTVVSVTPASAPDPAMGRAIEDVERGLLRLARRLGQLDARHPDYGRAAAAAAKVCAAVPEASR